MNKTIKNKKMKTISDSSTTSTSDLQNKKPISISTVSHTISSSSNSSIKSANTRVKNFN